MSPGSSGFQLSLTPALAAGRGRIEQCADCGALVATTDLAGQSKLGPCPACGCGAWWRQKLPVGPFQAVGDAS